MWPKKGISGGSKSSMGERAVHGRFSPDPPQVPVTMELKALEKIPAANEDSQLSLDPRNFASRIIGNAADYSSQLFSHFVDQKNRSDDEKAKRVVEEAKREMEAANTSRGALPDLSAFMTPVPVWELKHIRRTSHLCSLTYKQARVTPKAIRAMHNLELVASSWAYPFKPFDALSTAEDIEEEGDGMGAAVREIKAAAATKGETIRVEEATISSPDSSVPSAVARKLVEAAAAASGAAAMAAGPLASAAGSIYAGFQSLPLPGLPGGSNNMTPPSTSNGLSSPGSSSGGNQAAKLASALAGVAQAGGSQITSTLASSIGPSSSLTSSSGHVSSMCPSQWFVVDDCVNHLRTFVIQGSDTIDHWRLNLTFDPVSFEDPSLGVTVHRGVYEAARVLYSTFMPLVKDHLASSPLARVTFTGHSIGGSIATLLLFMYKHKSVLDNKHISTIYTFGAPTVFCEGPGEDNEGLMWPSADDSKSPVSSSFTNNYFPYRPLSDSFASQAAVASSSLLGGSGGSVPGPQSLSRAHEGGPSRLMSSLGLQERVVRNCIMHRDIVPRAFACDYSLVAEILRGWGSGFAMHCSLGGDGRKHLYYYVGRLIVLQPDSWHSFVGEGDDHPLLPPGPGIHYLSDPEAGALPKSSQDPSSSGRASDNGREEQAPPARRVLSCAHEAVMELMDSPHPLETLADPKAYLPFGSISRYHNPDNYTQALGRIMHLSRQVERSSGVTSVAIRRSNGRPDPSVLSESRDKYKRLAADMMDLCSDGNAPAWLWDSSDEDDTTPINCNVDPIGSYHA